MENLDAGSELNGDVLDEILRVKERLARAEMRRRRALWWVGVLVAALGVALIIAGLVVVVAAARSGGVLDGAIPGIPIFGAGVVLGLTGLNLLLLAPEGDAQTLVGGIVVREGLSDIEQHYRRAYPAEFAEAQRREEVEKRRRAQEAALKRGETALRASRDAITRERRREQREVGK